MIWNVGTLVSTLMVLVAGAVRADDQAREVKPAEVPAAVLKAVQERSPGAEFTRAYRYIEKNQDCCHLIGKDAKGRELTVEATDLGTILLFQTTIRMADVPLKVRKIIERDHQGKEFSHIFNREEYGDEPGTRRYDFECAGLSPNGEKLVLRILDQGPRN
jgi:hypothetical protein